MCKIQPLIFIPIVLLAIAAVACTAQTATPVATSTVSPSPISLPTKTSEPISTVTSSWVEKEIYFSFNEESLYGVVTLPTTPGPHPAVVIITGSVSPDTGVRHGAMTRYFMDLSRAMAADGYAALRYDPPGVGGSTGESGFDTLESRREEAMAALQYMQSRPDINPDRIGMWGISQGGWVITMAAAAYPDDVAFIIPVSGSGVSVADQQVYSIEAQSQAAGFAEEDIARAGLFGRLLIDWQLEDPIYKDENLAQAQQLGPGPWNDFLSLVYEPGEITPAESLQRGIDIFKAVKDEPWAEFLFLEELYLPQLESIPPEYAAEMKAASGPNLLNDPREYMTEIHCPVLAIFGENDLLQPTERSAELYEQYLTQAGNENFKIVVLPGVGHFIIMSTPGYKEAISEWLGQLFISDQ